MPISSVAPLPRMLRALRRKALASCGSKLPSVEPGKKPTFGIACNASGSANGAVKSAVDRMHFQPREVEAQFARLGVEEVAGNIDRHIGRDIRGREQDARLGEGAGAEFDQRRARRNQRADLAGAVAQDRRVRCGSGSIPAAA